MFWCYLLPESVEALDSEEDLVLDELSEDVLEDLSAVSDVFSLLVFPPEEAADFLLDEP